MSLEQQISKGDHGGHEGQGHGAALSALRNAKKYIIEAKTAGPEVTELPDADVLKIISKLAKQGRIRPRSSRSRTGPDLASGGAGAGGRISGIPAQAADCRGAYRRDPGPHRRDGSHVDDATWAR